MGCAASDMGITMSKQPTQQQPQQHYPHQQTRPVASVTPQQQQQQQHVVINTSNQEPVKQPTNQSAPPAPPQTTQPSAPPPAQEQSSNQNPVVVTRESIERYMALDRQIREAETRNPIKRLTAMKKALTDLQATEKQLLDNYNKCLADTAKEKADVDNLQQPNVRSFFKDQTLYDNKMSKEQEEYVEALNRQEVAQKEYIGVKEQRVQMEKDIAAGQNEADQLNRLYAEQDEMLGGFFDGNYGSELENRLEAELDMLLDRKQRVLVAKHKWQNGRLLIHHAVSQLAFGLQRWSWLTRIDPGNMPVRYQVATEARNNFIAASQNITNSQRYLSTIAFPYLKPDEIQTLNKATQHIYVDMQSQERYSHATECYTITHRRCAALLQWFDHVIDKTIMSDLSNAAQEAANKQQQLRSERLRLLQEKYTESSGETIQLEEGTVAVPEIPEADEQQLMALTEADKVSMAGEMPPTDGDNELAPGEPARQPTPLPLSDLAPPPSEEEIFGNIESLRKQHEQQMQEFDRAQESNRARMEQGLNEKLRARRSRRARLEGMEE